MLPMLLSRTFCRRSWRATESVLPGLAMGEKKLLCAKLSGDCGWAGGGCVEVLG